MSFYSILLIFAARSIFNPDIDADSTSIFVITDVDIFDGEKLIENTNLVFNMQQIIEVTDDHSNYPDKTLIIGSGKTIIPPLVNAHVHIWFPNSLKESLEAGIFANLDMHSTDGFANVLRSFRDSIAHSFYYSSNSGATVEGGHGTQFGIPVPIIGDTLTPLRFVRDRIKTHADYIKILKEPSLPTLTSQQTSEVIQSAHHFDHLAVAHVSRAQDALDLAQQGVDGLVHVWVDEAMSPEGLDSLTKHHVFVVPTLSVLKRALDPGRKSKWAAQTLPFTEVLDQVRQLHEAGIQILCGTDAPNFQMNYHDQIYEEMELLEQSGLTPEEVLQAATVNIYRAFRLNEFAGIEAGNPASFILCDGNPAKDIQDIKNPKVIYRNGHEIYR